MSKKQEEATETLIFLLFIIAIAILIVVTYRKSFAEDDHHVYHSYYQGWYNSLPIPQNCCNDQDCHSVNEGDEKEVSGMLAVRVEGQWCPILSHHYLSRGNVPDATKSHICVRRLYGAQTDAPGESPCSRILCYQPQPRV